MNIGYHSDFMDRIIERANKRNERTEKMINKMLDKSEPILNAGKPKPQTNEEWLRSCTTDEMVKTILDLCDYRPCFACGIGYCDDENWCHVYSDEAKEFVTEWLKQPHTFE